MFLVSYVLYLILVKRMKQIIDSSSTNLDDIIRLRMVVLTMVFVCLTIGFVTIKCEKSFVDAIVSKLSIVEGVQYIHEVTGEPYAIIASK